MKANEIAPVLGKLDGTIRKMLCKMQASHLIEETEQGYRAFVPKEEQVTQTRKNYDARNARDMLATSVPNAQALILTQG